MLDLYLNEDKLIEASRDGITKRVFQQIRSFTGLSSQYFAAFTHVGIRTVQRKKANEKISPEASERAVLIGKLFFRGEEVFGNKEKFQSWMNSNIPGFNGKKPKEMLDTITGISKIEDELIRIEHGIFS
jgi:putative toxin-antitoxin system antitoxin component (TIGR02293 family)